MCVPLCLRVGLCLSVCVLLQNGNSALSIARRLGYISVVDTLRAVTEETASSQVGGCCLFAHRQVELVAPEQRTKTLVLFREL